MTLRNSYYKANPNNFMELDVDISRLQQVQNAMSRATDVYVRFYTREGSRLTAFTNSPAEEAFIASCITPKMIDNLIHTFPNVSGDDVITIEGEKPFVMARGIAVRGMEDCLIGAWLVIGIDAEALDANSGAPAEIKTIKAHHFEDEISLFSLIIEEQFEAEVELETLDHKVHELEVASVKQRNLSQKADVLISILRMMESDEDFETIATELLKEASTYLDTHNVHLLKLMPDDESVNLVCEYASDEAHVLSDKLAGMKRADFPFFNGRPYSISSDSVLPGEFALFFEKAGISGGVFLPIIINERLSMYICFALINEQRRWSPEDIGFMNEMKRVLQDVLSKRVMKNSLASSYSVLKNIIEHAGCGVCVVDCDNSEMLYVNKSYLRIEQEEPYVKHLQEEILMNSEHDDEPQEFASPSGRHWYEISRTHMDWVDGRQVHLITVYDISNVKRYQAEIERQANEDYLTGIYNRMRFERDLDAEMHSVEGTTNHGAIILVDLDDFSNINEALGHQVGDELLRQIARSLKNISGIEDNCYRFGADEFVVLITHEKISILQSILDQITAVFSRAWSLNGVDYHCTCSIGVARVPRDGVNRSTLLKRVDIALHDAKKHGKNHIAFYDEDTMVNAFERLDMERHMRDAVEAGCEEFEVYYQPLVHSEGGANMCCGAEALVRWKSPELGLVRPDQFIPLAEYLGLINQIGRHVLRKACASCRHWNDFGHPDYKVNVNLSVVQLLQNDIVSVVKGALEESGLEPKNLTLEITESLAIHDMKYMIRVLNEIKNLGVRVALDDFGTGYSALNYLKEMPIDIIKIDKCFVEDVGEDKFSDAFLKTVTELAESLDMNICVEGVERDNQLGAVEGLHVDWIQGYLFDQPLPEGDFEKKYV